MSGFPKKRTWDGTKREKISEDTRRDKTMSLTKKMTSRTAEVIEVVKAMEEEGRG
jgi:hypothetical protein